MGKRGGNTLSFNRGGRRCAVVGYEARGRRGGQAVDVNLWRDDCFSPQHLG